MYLLLLVLPLFCAIFLGFTGRLIGYYGVLIISIFFIFCTFSISVLIFYEICFLNCKVVIYLSPWFESDLIKVYWSFLFDSLTSSMLLIITFISLLVHIYSLDYMWNDPHLPRFISFLGIFTFFMLILVTSNNFVQMFVGWEGVGLSSYLLINFWTTRLEANKSALKALIVNRVGDFGLTISIISIIYLFKSADYSIIFSITPFFLNNYFSFLNIKLLSLTFISFFLFIGIIGKSAQLGLHSWLPDAMEGPTPVSALIHAATMVTAGVFLSIRCSPLIEFSVTILFFFILFGSITAFFAAVVGIFQHDLKKVIAYSTCSQLGYMIFCCGLSCYNISMFHLVNHAFFKALLFLSAGSVIHAVNDEQDMRKLGSLINFLPLTYSLMLIGSLALTGFPFLTGFYSKDVILEISNIFTNKNLFFNVSSLSFWLGNFAAFFTSYYSFRLIYLTFLNSSNYHRINFLNISESSNFILFPLILLSVFSLFFGFIFRDIYIGIGTDMFNNSLFIFPYNYFHVESEFIFYLNKWIPFSLSLFGFFIASFINCNIFKFVSYKTNIFFYSLYFTINKKWFFDFIYNKFIIFPILNFGYNISFKNLDRGFLELISTFGLSILLTRLSFIFSKFQSGQLNHYLFFIVFWLIIFLNFYIFSFNYFLIIFYVVLICFI